MITLYFLKPFFAVVEVLRYQIASNQIYLTKSILFLYILNIVILKLYIYTISYTIYFCYNILFYISICSYYSDLLNICSL